ncbi:SIS domain-containing protein [Thalassotalea marina]|uniref:Phosphoheptose isomerase n=1 Tax=Thalassotalea marina TaxID=1673741 RepID=A0A919EHK1_9GAMM|nr:SIS domain-containing protein [Thalassotalea marina]GHF80433.1 phosphoheptose isomerase [Thalassotalea marina]
MSFYQIYSDQLYQQLQRIDEQKVDAIVALLVGVWREHKRLFICGNGGSAGNAQHLANDFSYGINPKGRAIDVEALPANSSVITCLANDTGYDNIFAYQLLTKARAGDVLLVLSGSGNSRNIINALEQAKELGVISIALVGYNGGKAKELADIVIHNDINDMQIAEDIQVIIGHWLMRQLNEQLENQQHD